ncbi:hypothetical protein GCM10027614_44520 [Micromonospora vulcania]
MFSLTRTDGHLLSTDPARFDLDRVHHWLSTDAYWALGRDRETVVRAFAGSLPFGVYRPEDGRQVAVARAVTDGATFAWLCDVYVDRSARGAAWAAGWPARSATTWPSWAYAGSCCVPTTHTRCTRGWASRRWTTLRGGCSWTNGRR